MTAKHRLNQRGMGHVIRIQQKNTDDYNQVFLFGYQIDGNKTPVESTRNCAFNKNKAKIMTIIIKFFDLFTKYMATKHRLNQRE